MGRDNQKNKKQSGKDKAGSGKEGKDSKKGVRKGIPKYQYLPKASLAPYPDEDGNALWLGDKESLSDLLTPAAVLNSRTPFNSEMLGRPGLALSLAAAAFQHGGGELSSGKAKKALEKLLLFFQEKDGKAFLAAASVLNLGKTGTASKGQVKVAAHDYVKFLCRDDEALQKALVGFVNCCSKMYLFGMHMVEQRAFFSKLGGWAKKWRRTGKEPSQLKPWIKEPENHKKLESGVVELIMEKSSENKKRANARDGSESARSGSSGGSSRSHSKKSSSSVRSRGSSKDSRAGKEKHKKDKKERRSHKDEKRSRKPSKRAKKDRKSRSHGRKKSKLSRSSQSASGARSVKSSASGRSRRGSQARSASVKSRPPVLLPRGLVSRLSLEDLDASSVASAPGAPDAMSSWSAEAAAKLSQQVALGLSSLGDKEKRMSNAAVTALLDEFPVGVLQIAGLEELKPKVKALTKNLRADKLEGILKTLQGLCVDRGGGACVPEATRASSLKRITVTIHRVGGATADGKALVREGDPEDTVEASPEDTIEDVLETFFKAQGSAEDRKNWGVKALGEDHKLLDIIPETMPVAKCRAVALLRKGG